MTLIAEQSTGCGVAQMAGQHQPNNEDLSLSPLGQLLPDGKYLTTNTSVTKTQYLPAAHYSTCQDRRGENGYELNDWGASGLCVA